MHSLNLANSSVILHRSLAARWAHENFQVFCWSCELHFSTNYRFITQVSRELRWTFPSMSSICCSAVNIPISIECVWVDDFTNKNKLNLAVVGRRVEFQILSFEQHPFPRGIRSVLAVYPILNKCSKKSSSSSTKGRTMWQRMSCEFFLFQPTDILLKMKIGKGNWKVCRWMWAQCFTSVVSVGRWIVFAAWRQLNLLAETDKRHLGTILNVPQLMWVGGKVKWR